MLHNTPNHAHFNRQRFVDLQALHHVVSLLPSKATHQVIFQRKVETGRAGIALASSTAAQLVINPAGFVTLRTNHVQAPQIFNALHVLNIFQESIDLGFINAIAGLV